MFTSRARLLSSSSWRSKKTKRLERPVYGARDFRNAVRTKARVSMENIRTDRANNDRETVFFRRRFRVGVTDVCVCGRGAYIITTTRTCRRARRYTLLHQTRGVPVARPSKHPNFVLIAYLINRRLRFFITLIAERVGLEII